MTDSEITARFRQRDGRRIPLDRLAAVLDAEFGIEILSIPQKGTSKRSKFNCHAVRADLAPVLPFARPQA